MNSIFKFYIKLCSSKNILDKDIENYMENINCVDVNESEKRFCDATPTLIECEEAVRSMKNKSPKQDGLPAEFYKMFWTELKDEYLKPLLKSTECGMPPFSQRHDIVN
jgi:hypothetical protein